MTILKSPSFHHKPTSDEPDSGPGCSEGGLGQCTLGGNINSSGCHTKVGRRGGELLWPVKRLQSKSRNRGLQPARFLFRCEALATAAGAAAVFRATRRCRAAPHILCCERNFLLTANARFPHQSVTAGLKVVIIANSSHVVSSGCLNADRGNSRLEQLRQSKMGNLIILE